MSDFDIDGARKAGYSDAEIADHLGKQQNFDVGAARKSGYSDTEILSHLSGVAPPSQSTGTKVARVAGQGAQGFNDAVADTAGAPVDAASWALRKVGVDAGPQPFGGSASIKKGLDYAATLPGRVGDAVSALGTAPTINEVVKPFSEDRTSRFEAVTPAEKAAHGAGSALGNAISVMVPAAAVANTARAGTVTQGVANALRSQPVLQGAAAATGGAVGEATDNPALGLATSLAVPVGASVVRRAVTPITNALTTQEQRLATAATNEGIPLTAAQRTGSPGLKAIESTMAKVPGSSGPMQDVRQGQREAFNSSVLKRAGVTAADASPEILDKAFTSAGQTFDNLASRTTLNADQKFASDVNQVAHDYGRRLPTDVAPVFQSYMDDLQPVLQAAQNGQPQQIPGQVYATIRSDIGKRIRAASGRPDLQEALGGLQTALDDAVERSTSGPLRSEWQDARREYQALMTVDKAMQGGTQADRSTGNIPFSGLKTAVRQADPRGFSRGRGQLNELSRVGEFISDKVPDSGTPTRQAILNPLMWPMMAAGNVGARAYNTAPVQNYLSNQLMGRTNYGAQLGGIAARQVLEEATGGQNALLRRGERQ